MGFIFRGYDDETGIPRFDYIPELIKPELDKPADNYIPKSPPPRTSPQIPPSPIPPSPPTPKIKPVADPTCPNPILFFGAGCVVGAVVILVLTER